MGFYYGISSSSLTTKITATVDNSFSATIAGLASGNTYYYKAYATVSGTGTYASQSATFYGDVQSFTTTSAEPALAGRTGWLEMPAASAANSSHFVSAFFASGARNYSYLYDKSTYTSYWVAYPLASFHTGGTRDDSWVPNPNLPTSDQINIWSGSYNVNLGSTTSEGYSSSSEYYARGHQIPDADRSNVSAMQEQTYYATNSTPQIQNKFNGGIWMQLETAVRGEIPANDTLYVVTGAAFRKTGGSETITYIYPKWDSEKACPVPNYYYKVLLKVARTGGTVTSASAIGFWLPHTTYNNSSSWSNYAVSVDQIEEWTGFDFFVNLPPSVAATAEANTSWSTFQSF